ncbi:glycosyltransferase family 39 protein [bacterium]|nr:glycosyltransferase family 39 protein [bacterium]
MTRAHPSAETATDDGATPPAASGAGLIPGRWSRRLSAINLAFALLLAFLVLAVAASRIGHKFELEFEEGDIFLTALRVLDGKEIYPHPDEDPTFVPLLYPPGYYYICAAFIAIFGKSIAVCRAVSFAAALGLVALVYLVGRRAGARKTHAAAAALAFLAFYPLTGYWYDLARLDAVFLLLSLAAFVLIDRREPRIAHLAGAGAMLAAAVYTKQVAVFYAGAAVVALIWNDRKRGLVFAGVLAAVGLAIAAAYEVASDGQFSFYVMKVGASHQLYPARLLNPWPVLRACGPLVLAVALIAFFRARQKPSNGESRESSRGAPIWVLFLAASIPCAMLPWAKAGNYLNDFIPIFLALAILVARADHDIARLLLPVQFALCVFNPFAQIPDAKTIDEGNKFIASLAAEKGETLVLDHPYYAWLAGKPLHPKGMFIAETQKAGQAPPAALRRAIDERHFSRVLVDVRPPFDVFSSEIMGRYRTEGELVLAPRPMTGTIIYPRYAMLPFETIATVDLSAPTPEGFERAGDELHSAPLPAQASSVSFLIDGDAEPRSTVFLAKNDGTVLFRTAGIPGRPPLRARWGLNDCGDAGCRLVIKTPMQKHAGRAVSELQIER